MALFEDVGLQWQGKEYIVPSDKVMGLVAVIEDVITIEELVGAGVKRVKMAKAFAAALRYAGAEKVDEEEVYKSLFSGDAKTSTVQIVSALLAMMIPPENLRSDNQSSDGKKPPAARKKPAPKRSRKRT